MPRYEFRCDEGHVTEAVRGYDCGIVPCAVCGASASRVPIYMEQIVIGETVAKPRLGNRATDRHGRFDLGLVTEAQHEIVYDAARAGVEPPDLFGQAKRRAASQISR